MLTIYIITGDRSVYPSRHQLLKEISYNTTKILLLSLFVVFVTFHLTFVTPFNVYNESHFFAILRIQI